MIPVKKVRKVIVKNLINDGAKLGVSLKAGGKKTSEPQLNTYVTPIFNAFGEKRKLDALMKTAYSQVYSKIKGMPPENKFMKDRKNLFMNQLI